MAGVSFIFDQGNLGQVQRIFGELRRLNEDTYPTMLAIAQVGSEKSQERFELQRAPDGTPWLPSMAAKREKRKTLIRTGHFKQNTFSAEATEDTATWGTNAVQGRIFQLGGTVHHEARAGKTRLRLAADGTLKRQAKYPKLAMFARRSHKRVKEVDHQRKAYDVTVIARPFLGVDDQDRATFTTLYLDRFSRFLHASGMGGS